MKNKLHGNNGTVKSRRLWHLQKKLRKQYLQHVRRPTISNKILLFSNLSYFEHKGKVKMALANVISRIKMCFYPHKLARNFPFKYTVTSIMRSLFTFIFPLPANSIFAWWIYPVSLMCVDTRSVKPTLTNTYYSTKASEASKHSSVIKYKYTYYQFCWCVARFYTLQTCFFYIQINCV